MDVLRSNKQNKTLHPKMIESARKSKLTTVRLVTLCDRSIKNVNTELFSGCGQEFAKNFDSSKYPLDRIVKLVNKNLNIELVPLDLAQQLRNVNEKASLSIPPSLTGIWLLPSFINHSCIPNAVRIYIGDICIVRAITDIAIGEEVLISYVPLRLFPNVQERNNFLGFQCDCNLCEFERKPDVHNIIIKFIKLEDYLRPYVEGHITLADPYPYPVQRLLPKSKDKKISRKKWLVLESEVFDLFAQIKSHQSVDLFSISFQNCVSSLISMSTTNEDTIEILPKAEPFISLFEPETYLMFWFLFYSVMWVKEKYKPHDPLFDHVEKQYYAFQNLLK